LEQELQKARELIKTLQAEIDSLQKKDFSIDDIKDDDHLTELYTGISTYGAFKFLSAKLEGKVAKMQYYKGTYSHKSKRYQVNESQAKPGRKRALNCDNELLMVLARLRQGLSVEDLAFRFSVSQYCLNNNFHMGTISGQGIGKLDLLAKERGASNVLS